MTDAESNDVFRVNQLTRISWNQAVTFFIAFLWVLWMGDTGKTHMTS